MQKPRIKHINSNAAKSGRQKAYEQKRSRGFLAQQSKRNQNFHFAKAHLNTNEVRHFFEQMIAILKNQARKERDKTAAKILLISFWTGRPVEDVAQFALYRRRSDNLAHEGLYLQGGELYWILWVPGPGVNGDHLSDQSPAHKVTNNIKLKVPRSFNGLLKPHIDKIVEQRDKQIFNINPFQSRNLCQKLLRSIKDTRNKRLNLARIAGYLFMKLAHHPSSDFATALLTLGVTPAHQISQSSYTALAENYLQTIYDDVGQILESVLGLTDVPSLLCEYTPIKNLPDCEVYMGTPFRPKRDAVQSLITGLQTEIQHLLEQDSWSLEDIIHLQKPYVLYNWLFYAFSSGARPVARPTLNKKHINMANGLSVISDKDKDGMDNPREIWLWDEMRAQIALYYEHIAVLLDRIGSNVPSLLKLYRYQDVAGHLFMINDDLKLEFLTPARIAGILKSDYRYDMPANSHRHYLRSNLLERGCPVEAIDCFLGHARKGQEPLTKYSALSPVDLVDSLRQYLVPLLREDGWQVLSGLTWKTRR